MAFEYRKILEEPFIYGWLLVIFAFLYITFNPTLAGIYSVMVMSSFILYMLFDKKITVNSARGNTFQSIFWAVMTFAIFSVISIFVSNFLQNWAIAQVPFESVMQNILLPQGMQSLPLAENAIIAVIVWGLLIPVVETVLLGRMLVATSDVTNIELRLNNYLAWLLFIPISAGFVWFHIGAKNIDVNAPLLLTFVFGYLTCAMIVYFKEMESAIYLHNMNNILATLNILRKGIGV